MPQQFLRKVRLTVGSLQINHHESMREEDGELKIEFEIDKDISSTSNDATIKIWNLSKEHRNAVGKEFDDVLLEGGYQPHDGSSNVGILFYGQIRDVYHDREGTNIITEITCGDGDKAIRKAAISKSFKKGTPIKDVLEQVQKDLEAQGVNRGEWRGVDDLPKLKRPLALCGSCKREMDMLGRSHNFYWSIQNGATEIIPSDEALEQVVVLNKQTGLLGVPTLTDNGVIARALLNPELRPNRRVIIESDVLEMNAEGGEYRVASLKYGGTNFDQEYYAEFEGESFSGGKVDEGVK